ncbi:MAG: hypothetical protein V1850_07830 [Candidatus Bathyarchaeota archaeon]
MAVSIFAKSFKEAKQYTGVLTVALVTLMLVLLYLPPATLSQLIFLPFLGPVIVIRNGIFNIWTPGQFIICLASSIAYLLILIYVAFKTFSKETVIFRV